MKCPKCESKKTIAHTDKDLRESQNYLYQCFDCDTWWINHYEIVEVPTSLLKILWGQHND